MKIIVHIGMERTSSTSIQKSLFKQQKYLNDNKIYYLHTEKKNCVDAAIAFGTNPTFDFFDVYNISEIEILKKRKSEIIENFKSRLASLYEQKKYDACIISSEHFSSRLVNIEDVEFFHKTLQYFSDEIEIVIFKRNDEKFIESLYSMALCSGHNIEFEDFSNQLINDPRYFPIESIISKWQSVFNNKVKVIDFNLLRLGEDPTNIFLQLIKSDLKIDENIHINKTKSRLTLSILQQINRYFPKYSSWDSGHTNVFIGNMLRLIVLKFSN